MSEADEFADLVERLHQIEEMTDTLGWQLFRDRAVVDMAKTQAAILGGALERDDYLRLTGQYTGMKAILDLPARLRHEVDVERSRLQEELEALEEQFEPEPAA